VIHLQWCDSYNRHGMHATHLYGRDVRPSLLLFLMTLTEPMHGLPLCMAVQYISEPVG